MSCGEYGDNVKTLVNAINNGKYDIREGSSFPVLKEGMNNCTAATGILKNAESMEKVKMKDKNDISNLEEKFAEDKQNEISNGKLITGYATNDIAKQGINALAAMWCNDDIVTCLKWSTDTIPRVNQSSYSFIIVEFIARELWYA